MGQNVSIGRTWQAALSFVVLLAAELLSMLIAELLPVPSEHSVEDQ